MADDPQDLSELFDALDVKQGREPWVSWDAETTASPEQVGQAIREWQDRIEHEPRRPPCGTAERPHVVHPSTPDTVRLTRCAECLTIVMRPQSGWPR